MKYQSVACTPPIFQSLELVHLKNCEISSLLILKLRVHAVNQETGKFDENKSEELIRPQVIEMIGKKKISPQLPRALVNGGLGAKLEIISVTTDYLKTKNDSSTKDILENLPTF